MGSRGVNLRGSNCWWSWRLGWKDN